MRQHTSTSFHDVRKCTTETPQLRVSFNILKVFAKCEGMEWLLLRNHLSERNKMFVTKKSAINEISYFFKDRYNMFVQEMPTLFTLQL